MGRDGRTEMDAVDHPCAALIDDPLLLASVVTLGSMRC
jgi:hypothetical protein